MTEEEVRKLIETTERLANRVAVLERVSAGQPASKRQVWAMLALLGIIAASAALLAMCVPGIARDTLGTYETQSEMLTLLRETYDEGQEDAE